MPKYQKKIVKSNSIKNRKPSKNQKAKLRRETAVKIDVQFSRQKKHSFSADTKLHFDQIKKLEANLTKSHYLIESQTFLKVKTTKNFCLRKLNNITWSCLGNLLNLSPVSLDLQCFAL